jgi:hypothetical protein
MVKKEAPGLYKLYGGKIKKLNKPKKFKNMKGGYYGEQVCECRYDYGDFNDIEQLLKNSEITDIANKIYEIDTNFSPSNNNIGKFNELRSQLYIKWMNHVFCNTEQYGDNLRLCHNRLSDYITFLTPNITEYKRSLTREKLGSPDSSNVDTPESNLWSRPSSPVSTPGGRNILYNYYSNYTNQNGGNTELNKLRQEIINIRTGNI